MAYQYVVLGSGRQGVAIAYDLAKNCEAKRVLLVDIDSDATERAVQRLRQLLPADAALFAAGVCDIADQRAVADVLRGADVAVSAVPYRFNVALTDAAISAGASFCDLGGNTAIVREQLSRDERAKAAGISVAPDCGLAPGLGNILAAHGVAQLDKPREAHVRCGGLPEKPVGPLGYKLLFNFQGLINEYSGFGEFLRKGERIDVPTLTELEQIEFPEPIGICEAAVTSGGTSTCPDSFRGTLDAYDYKTVRYPGHFAIVRAMFELGCFDEKIALSDGRTLEPKRVLRDLMEERLRFSDVRDITVLRATVIGERNGAAATIVYDLLDRHDETTGFTAMERTTAFPTALVAHLQARRQIEPGASPLERCVPLDCFMKELGGHDIRIEFRTR